MEFCNKNIINNISVNKKQIILDGIVVGLFSGFISICYRYILFYLEDINKYLYSKPPTIKHITFLILIFSILGSTIGIILKLVPLSSGSGIPQVQGELMGIFNMNEKKTLFAKFCGGCISAIGGLSLGREGPSIQLGASCGKIVSKLLKKDINNQRMLISAGASAGLSAAFSAPISGTLFVLEEMNKSFSPLILVPAIIASVIADFISKNFFGLKPVFSFKIISALPLSDYLHIIFLGIFIGLIGILFTKTLLITQDLYNFIKINKILKPIIPFIFSIVFGYNFIFVIGSGHSILESLAQNRVSLYLLIVILILKIIFTSICYGSSAQGGIFLPMLVIGAISGAIYYQFISKIAFINTSNDYLVNFMILGMAGMLTCILRSPIISIMLVTELTGSFNHISALCLVSIISYLIAETFKLTPIYEELLHRMIPENFKNNSNKIFAENKVMYEHTVESNSYLIDKTLEEINLPLNFLIISIDRIGKEIIPNGKTKIKSGDKLYITTDSCHLLQLDNFFKIKI